MGGMVRDDIVPGPAVCDIRLAVCDMASERASRYAVSAKAAVGENDDD